MRQLSAASLALLSLAATVAFESPAHADDASTFRTEGVTIRLVAENPDADGRLRGAVVFDLDTDWKTYWLDPGPSGLAPHFDFGGSTGVSIETPTLPVPERFLEGEHAFNGYDQPMAAAFEGEAKGDASPQLSLSLTVGVCRDICVPVQAQLKRDLSAAPSLDEAMAIDRAFLALPRNGDGEPQAQLDGDVLVLSGLPPHGPDSDVFVSSPDGWSFGRAQEMGDDWHVPVRSRPKAADAGSLTVVTRSSGGGQRFLIDFP